MDVCSYTHARQNLAKLMDKAAKGDQIVIHRQGAKPVVMVSLEDYEELDETAYLLSSPANARRLRESLKDVEEGRIVTFNSIDDLHAATKKKK
jgi:antitoxin YefM